MYNFWKNYGNGRKTPKEKVKIEQNKGGRLFSDLRGDQKQVGSSLVGKED